jgi:hypothetical protein
MAKNLAELGISTLQILHLVGIKRIWTADRPAKRGLQHPDGLSSVSPGTGNSPAPSFIMCVHLSGLVLHFPILKPGRRFAHG